MKTVTIREAQHNLGKILLEVEAGQTVQITRRRVPLARLVPEPSRVDDKAGVDWSDHAVRVVSNGKSTHSDEVLDDLRGDR
ncbi:type II toxin-antitoxin system prevent-host-death family antitoxin [Opitutaceae bacterium]|nr:type II toxin-antitoxin system prevent-host-death family antitoxin [Opitutaceae bacterium]